MKNRFDIRSKSFGDTFQDNNKFTTSKSHLDCNPKPDVKPEAVAFLEHLFLQNTSGGCSCKTKDPEKTKVNATPYQVLWNENKQQ